MYFFSITILVFRENRDVLNLEQSIFSGKNADFLVKPFFALEKIAGLNIFTTLQDNWQITSSLYVSQKIKAAAKAQGMVGFNFEDVNASRFSYFFFVTAHRRKEQSEGTRSNSG